MKRALLVDPRGERTSVAAAWPGGSAERHGPALLGEAFVALRYGVGRGHSQWTLSDPGPTLRRAREVVATDGRRVPRLLRRVSTARASSPD